MPSPLPEISTETSTEIYNQSISQSIDSDDMKINKDIKTDRQIDVFTNITENYNKTIKSCEINHVDEKYRDAVTHAIKLLYLDIENKKRINIGDNIIPVEIVEKDMEKLSYFVIEHAVKKFKEASREKEIRNTVAYLKTCIYNSIHEVEVDVDSELRYQGLI